MNNPKEISQENAKETNNFQVFVRVRPLNSKEISLGNPKKKQNIIKKQENMVIIYYEGFLIYYDC